MLLVQGLLSKRDFSEILFAVLVLIISLFIMDVFAKTGTNNCSPKHDNRSIKKSVAC